VVRRKFIRDCCCGKRTGKKKDESGRGKRKERWSQRRIREKKEIARKKVG